MRIEDLKNGSILRGSVFPEPVHVIALVPMGDSVKVIGKGMRSSQVHDLVLTASQIAKLEAAPEIEPFDGDPQRFRLGVEALRLALAFEYDPYFSLSIARIDPLPHQLEAVYEYFLKLPRIRFLLADDPGAGKTIMAGLLIKELKIRGLVNRILIVAPANLCFQWQREMKDKFREQFELIRGEVLRANYGQNPWQERNQVVTSVAWISRVEDAKNSLLRSEWDLVIIDEAHKLSAYSRDKKTLAYQIGEDLSERTDHFLMMTATPHKGDPDNFCLFLELLDRDVYGDVKSLEEAMRRNSAPFYLRRIKEALYTFPNEETGKPEKLFTPREVQTVGFKIDDEEAEFYEELTRYVEEQSIKAAADESARGRALGFTMAMLQRRFASSLYAVRRSLERMRNRRQKILEDPEAYRQEQITKKLPDDYEDLEEEEQQKIQEELEAVVASVDPHALKEEIHELEKLIVRATGLEEHEIETKLNKLREIIEDHGIFDDENAKLLIFTEHKDTLDYLVEKLRSWSLTVTQIHGGMKIGDRDQPGTRLYAEVEFRDQAQILVATEAAGEGINLQFCWFMINYDIPWNPVRLEQRMGRIHRYGQTHACLILNFVAQNTREGRVMEKLLERLHEIRGELGDKVFDVVGEVFPANLLERLFRDLYVRKTRVPEIEERIATDIDASRIATITESALEGLARRELNLSQIIGKSAEAKERRLVPEVIEDFFVQASPMAGATAKELRGKAHHYRVDKIPKNLRQIGERQESRFGRLAKAYRQIVFDKAFLPDDPTSEWVTPGHPLFEAVREDMRERARDDLERGAVFFDLHAKAPYLLDVFSAAIRDGRGNAVMQRLFVVRSGADGEPTITQPTVFLDLQAAPKGTAPLAADSYTGKAEAEAVLIENALTGMLDDVRQQRKRETDIVSEHVTISLNALIDRQNKRLIALEEEKAAADEPTPLMAANIQQVLDRIEELNDRQEAKLDTLSRERELTIGGVQHVGRAWVLPHPERQSPEVAPMVRDDEVERIAVETAIAYEESRGWVVESVEADNRGFDLISRLPHPDDPKTAMAVKFIEVKGRAHVGPVALTTNEYRTAQRLKDDYWLYVVYNCATKPDLHVIQNPARLEWEPVVTVEHYSLRANQVCD